MYIYLYITDVTYYCMIYIVCVLNRGSPATISGYISFVFFFFYRFVHIIRLFAVEPRPELDIYIYGISQLEILSRARFDI